MSFTSKYFYAKIIMISEENINCKNNSAVFQTFRFKINRIFNNRYICLNHLSYIILILNAKCIYCYKIFYTIYLFCTKTLL